MTDTYATLDEALEELAAFSPDLKNGLTNHAPMAAEALCALGRPQSVLPWVRAYSDGMLPWPAAQNPIPADAWRTALAQESRVSDWRNLFALEIEAAPWQQVLNRWVGRLAPGICASAAHGVIRVGHAVRSLGRAETAPRRAELADALASWAYAYQELPTAPRLTDGGLRARDAIAKVALQPPETRHFSGTIVSSLAGLRGFPEFAAVIGLLDVDRPAAEQIPELTEVFTRVYLANAHDFLTSIVFVHGVTSIAALGHMLPYLEETTQRSALRYAWQASCGLYAAFGTKPMLSGALEPPAEDKEKLIDLAIANGDEHAIKFTEACLQQNAVNPCPAYLAAARHAIDALRPG